MGVNTVRLYHHAINKELLRQLYRDYGIRVIMGDDLGMYAKGSGASWYEGTDYTNPKHLENMRDSVREMVNEYKDEPYVLMWMLGNESNYGEVGDPDPASGKVGLGSNAKAQPEAHYSFVNEVAGMIKSIDPTRPVGYSNGETITIDILSKHSHNIDVFGVNAYRGSQGFGRSLWEDVRDFMNKPVLLTEYGCPAYYSGKSAEFAEEKQFEYHKGNWEDIVANNAGSGYGNAIGGVVFEFVDEWWKAGPPPKFSAAHHENIGQFPANFPDGWMYEEWLGLASQGDGSQSPLMRQLRKAYNYYQKVWNE
jgi:beta-glucuronidase